MRKTAFYTLVSRENGGLSAVRNADLDRVKRAYVYFLGSDDFLREDALETLNTKGSCENPDVLKFSAHAFSDGCQDFTWVSDGG